MPVCPKCGATTGGVKTQFQWLALMHHCCPNCKKKWKVFAHPEDLTKGNWLAIRQGLVAKDQSGYVPEMLRYADRKLEALELSYNQKRLDRYEREIIKQACTDPF